MCADEKSQKAPGRWRSISGIFSLTSFARIEAAETSRQAPAPGPFQSRKTRYARLSTLASLRSAQSHPPHHDGTTPSPTDSLPHSVRRSSLALARDTAVAPRLATLAVPLRGLPMVALASLGARQLPNESRTANPLTTSECTPKNRNRQRQYTPSPCDSRACSRRSSVLSNSSPHVHV